MASSPGMFVAVVGPSGAGKDSLISHGREVFANDDRMLFVKRVVTRPADLGAEDHDTMSLQDFETIEACDGFAVTWRAHGLAYGIPSHALEHVHSGGMAIANCSRNALADLREVFGNFLIIDVTADARILAERIAGRGRETAEEIAARMRRDVMAFDRIAPIITIDNSGRLEDACAAFASALSNLRQKHVVAMR